MRPWGSNPSLKHLPIGKCLLSTVAQLPMQAAVQKQAKTRISRDLGKENALCSQKDLTLGLER